MRRLLRCGPLWCVLAACESVGGIEDRSLVPAGAMPDAAMSTQPARDAADRDPTGGRAPDASACAAPSGSCPAEMAALPGSAACIDRFEASRGDGDRAQSLRGMPPWSDVTAAAAASACAAAGKRLCTDAEWRSACRGTCGRAFPYGEAYDARACGGVDGADGRTTLPTGSLQGCEGGVPGVFDLSGNVAEWLASGSLAGGSSADGPAALGCDARSPAPAPGAPTGFRCCK